MIRIKNLSAPEVKKLLFALDGWYMLCNMVIWTTKLSAHLHHGHDAVSICSKDLHHVFASRSECTLDTTNFHSFDKHSSQTEWYLYHTLQIGKRLTNKEAMAKSELQVVNSICNKGKAWRSTKNKNYSIKLSSTPYISKGRACFNSMQSPRI
jgi:hypothetical protein